MKIPVARQLQSINIKQNGHFGLNIPNVLNPIHAAQPMKLSEVAPVRTPSLGTPLRKFFVMVTQMIQ